MTDLDQLGQLALRFRSAKSDKERREIGYEYAVIWERVKDGDETPPPEYMLPEGWMPSNHFKTF